MKFTRKCFGCKEEFRKEELVEYSSATGKTSNWYCPKCLAEKQSRELFMNRVCKIFGIKAPGPLIWTQRKRLKAEYGYTDESIVDCLEYLYKVEHYKILKDSLGLVAPWSMEKMREWKKNEQARASSIAAAIANTPMKEYIVPIKENVSKKKEINLDDGLFDD